MRSRCRMCRALVVLGVFLVVTAGVKGDTISIFPTGTSVDLTLTIDTVTNSVIGSDVRGLAGFVVTSPPIASGVLVGDFGLFPPPSNELLGEDALTLSQFLLFTLHINAFTLGGPGIEVPVSTIDVTSPITDPALLEFRHPLLFGFAVESSTTVGNTQTVVLSLQTVEQVVPEPASITLLACGLAALGWLRRRRA